MPGIATELPAFSAVRINIPEWLRAKKLDSPTGGLARKDFAPSILPIAAEPDPTTAKRPDWRPQDSIPKRHQPFMGRAQPVRVRMKSDQQIVREMRLTHACSIFADASCTSIEV